MAVQSATSELPAQPGGFEGLLAVEEDLSPRDLAVRNPEDEPPADLGLCLARLAASREDAPQQDPVVPGFGDLVHLEIEALSRFDYHPEPGSKCRLAPVDVGWLRPEDGVLPFDVGTNEGDERIYVSSLKSLDVTQSDLHVLLRHRQRQYRASDDRL